MDQKMGVFCPISQKDDDGQEAQDDTIGTVTGLQLSTYSNERRFNLIFQDSLSLIFTHFSPSVNNALDGTVPALELSLLSHLEVLNLSWNALTGFFELSKLPASLEHISFIVNQFQTTLHNNLSVVCTTKVCNTGRLVNLQSLRLTNKKDSILSGFGRPSRKYWDRFLSRLEN
jgi:hypothetical protein